MNWNRIKIFSASFWVRVSIILRNSRSIVHMPVLVLCMYVSVMDFEWQFKMYFLLRKQVEKFGSQSTQLW